MKYFAENLYWFLKTALSRRFQPKLYPKRDTKFQQFWPILKRTRFRAFWSWEVTNFFLTKPDFLSKIIKNQQMLIVFQILSTDLFFCSQSTSGINFMVLQLFFDEVMINKFLWFFFGGGEGLEIFPKKKQKSQKCIFWKYHIFVKNSCTTIKFIPDVLWEQKKRSVDEVWKTINMCWFLMILAKTRFCEKGFGSFSTSKCSKTRAFQNWLKSLKFSLAFLNKV